MTCRPIVLLYASFFSLTGVAGQEKGDDHVVIVTLDGFRWQELFEGADQPLLLSAGDAWAINRFSAPTPRAARERLMPFMWRIIGAEGQLHGNRRFGNKVKCSNIYRLSYPGYSEMLVGHTDRRIRSNRLKANPNATVLEFLQNLPGFRDRVAVFSSWDAFPYIVREETSGLIVNAAEDLASGEISDVESSLNRDSRLKNGARRDIATFQYATEFMKRAHPRVVLVSLNETDEYGHRGAYNKYLGAAHRADSLIGALWDYLQRDSLYKGRTTLLISTDHGRGLGKRSWKKHGIFFPASSQVWIAAIGPYTPALGELRSNGKTKLKQVAPTIAALLNLAYSGKKRTAPSIDAIAPSFRLRQQKPPPSKSWDNENADR